MSRYSLLARSLHCETYATNLAAVLAAQKRTSHEVIRTPALRFDAEIPSVQRHTFPKVQRATSTALPRLVFKCEQFQRTGSFKFRGAFNSVVAARERMGDKLEVPFEAASTVLGVRHTNLDVCSIDAMQVVVTHSSGNHAAATALACRLGGVKSHIVMPEDANRLKVSLVQGYGGGIEFCGPGGETRLKASLSAVKRLGPGAVLIGYVGDAC